MNDARFKELLNLHLDHRLSADEARELEQALRADATRLREFRAYVALSKGCAELFRRSAADAPAPDALVRALRDAERRMDDRSRRRLQVRGWGTWGVTAGAAALVALVVARVSQPSLIAVSDEDRPAIIPVRTSPQVALASASSSGAPRVYATSRSTLPEHLTLAALGIESGPVATATSLSRWQSSEDGSSVSAMHAASWMNSPAGSTAEWNSTSSTATQFVGRPINAWAAQSGYQMQAAGYTFER